MAIWRLVGDQVRAGFGGAYALDLGAVLVVLQALGVEQVEFELVKQKRLFALVYGGHDGEHEAGT